MGDVVQGPWPKVSWRKGRPLPPTEAQAHTTPPAGQRRSSSWMYTPSSSGLHCKFCDRPFAAGHVPTDGTLICRECREDNNRPPEPTLFDTDPGGDA